MKLKRNSEIPEICPTDKNIKDVMIKILIGPEDGSDNIIMRLFRILPGGHTPFHAHDFEHVVEFVQGKGAVRDESGKEHIVEEGQSLFVAVAEKHQFTNPFNRPFEFICTILNPDKKER